MERTDKHPGLVTLITTVLVVAVLYLAKSILLPFALAMLLSFLLAPLVLKLQHWRLNRVLAVLTSVLLVAIVVSAVGWLVVGQVRDVTTNLSEYKQNIHEKLVTARTVVGQPIHTVTTFLEELATDALPPDQTEPTREQIQTVRVAESPRGPFALVSDTIGPTLDIVLTAGMAFVFAFLMLMHRSDLGDRLMRVMGQDKILVTTRALEEAAKRVSQYLWRFLLLNGLHGLLITIGLMAIGVPNAILWGLLAATLRFIPYIGPWVAAVFPVVTAFAASPGWSQTLQTVGLLTSLELISNNILEPWVYGRGTGLSPLAILVSALFWTWLWGPVGLVLSTPLTVCMVVMGKHVPQLRFLYLMFGDAPGLTPPERLYQRLIAGDLDQAWLVVRPELDTKSLCEVYDSILLPSLTMAERDRNAGALGGVSVPGFDETVRLLVEECGELRVGPDAMSKAGTAPVFASTVRVLVLPARAITDAVAANMLKQLLERDGIHVEVSSVAELSSETLDAIEDHRVTIACISTVPPTRFMHVRYLCKRIAARFPNLPIVAGAWTLELESKEWTERIPVPTNVHIVGSLREARNRVHQLAALTTTAATDVAALGPG